MRLQDIQCLHHQAAVTLTTATRAPVAASVLMKNENAGCSFCGVVGHIAWNCPKRHRPR
ncbi:hypothetical protein BDF20DRAFT_843501 [Mycotypha africana]|uniref:uncharacterized protein n=1 Tax=Mycotypha africana TaxID=64632 RepID=UPI002300EC97|nr:uncharacterized protein BDF20DRAFT_843501 [Mycotypha africana]KAI8991237.1 hypothetical protein BDF20DRAFT_843501 [Mycotypha africana]